MKKVGVILIGAIILIVTVVSIPTLRAQMKLNAFEDEKQVSNETKVVTFDEFWDLYYTQTELAQELEATTKYSLIAEKVRDGNYKASTISQYLHEHQDLKVKIEIPITTYKDDNKTITFISGEGEILEVYKDGQWKEFDEEI
ncbi:hypothetical protein [Pontibacillus salipaludis]|uniref:hypothetical protein n=1 Tax=Pontibacillus salipaludis TaxID=1697394 RepID=UPI0031F01DE0